MESLLSVKNLNSAQVLWLLRTAQARLEGKPTQLKGTVVNLFFEPSTRTSLSFQMAAQRLGLHTLHFSVEKSSVCKGESLIDSLQTVDALGVDIAIVRHGDDWLNMVQDQALNLSLVNAGSGYWEHPTQALLDALTIYQHFGTFQNLTVAIAGDVHHSRVARSDAILFQKLGAKVIFTGPEKLSTNDITGVAWMDFDSAISAADVVIMLRVQHERHQTAFNITNYNQQYGLNDARLKQLKNDTIILHPGPVNRNVEITDSVLDNPRCKVLKQVTNGVAIRMAVLEWCMTGGKYGHLVSA